MSINCFCYRAYLTYLVGLRHFTVVISLKETLIDIELFAQNLCIFY